jgi:hypothetical protein
LSEIADYHELIAMDTDGIEASRGYDHAFEIVGKSRSSECA